MPGTATTYKRSMKEDQYFEIKRMGSVFLSSARVIEKENNITPQHYEFYTLFENILCVQNIAREEPQVIGSNLLYTNCEKKGSKKVNVNPNRGLNPGLLRISTKP